MIQPSSEDRQLVDAVIAGDQEAFRTLVDRESQAVIRVCHRIVRDPVDAQDAAQDTFLRAYRSLATYRGDGSFGAWLRRIAVRVALARLAARPDVIRLDAEALDPRAANLRSGEDPEARSLETESRMQILGAVEALPVSQREVIMLRYYGDMSLQEIAALTSNPLGTVKSRLNRGVRVLREQLAARPAP